MKSNRAELFFLAAIVLGNKRDRVRQYGQAVTPPAMTLLTGRCAAALA